MDLKNVTLPKCSEKIFYTRPERFEHRGHLFEAGVYADVHDAGAHIEPVFFHVVDTERVEILAGHLICDKEQLESFYMEFLDHFWGDGHLSDSWSQTVYNLIDAHLARVS